MDKLKNRLKYSKKKLMRFSHLIYLWLNKFPRLIRYLIAIILLIMWGIFTTNPLLPWWLLIIVGIWIFLPETQYKYVGKYFKSDKIRKIEKDVTENIENILKTNPKRYYKYKVKIKKFLKSFK
jgi:c-di-AMP phosphodiesterase-like protein